MPGTLKIKVLKAELKRDTDWFGKMDPYVMIQLDNKNPVFSSVKDKMGMFPEWNESFCYRCSIGQKISIEILDSDLFKKDDIVG